MYMFGEQKRQDEWFDDVELLLEDIRKNSIILERLHKKSYFYYKNQMKYFRIPSIILNGMNSVLALSLADYVGQATASTTNCGISLFIAIIASLEAYFQIQANMENELMNSKEYYLIAVDIFKTLNLERERRPMGGIQYLDDTMVKYQKLIEKSNLYERKIHDQLIPIENNLTKTKPLTPQERRNSGVKKSASGMLFEMVDTSSGDSSINGDENV